MKKLVLFLVLGMLLISLICVNLVVGDNNDTGNGNQNQGNETEVCDSNNLELCLDETSCTDAGGFWYDEVCNGEEQETDDNGGTTVTKTRTRGNKTESFLPWQKRTEEDCPEGCKCVGAVVMCKTETGKTMTIEAGRSGNIITITIVKGEKDNGEEVDDDEDVEVDTELEIETETEENGAGKNKTRLKAKLSNGRKAEIKIMPDTASERALERLRLKVCSEDNDCIIELKEVGKGDNAELKYELQIERHSRILGIFAKKMRVRAEINAENGEVKVKKPWWAFLAVEPEE